MLFDHLGHRSLDSRIDCAFLLSLHNTATSPAESAFEVTPHSAASLEDIHAPLSFDLRSLSNDFDELMRLLAALLHSDWQINKAALHHHRPFSAVSAPRRSKITLERFPDISVSQQP